MVGYLRRADFGFSVGYSIGYGYIHSEKEPITNKYLLDGEYAIESMDVKHKAKIHLKPLFDPENKHLNGFY